MATIICCRHPICNILGTSIGSPWALKWQESILFSAAAYFSFVWFYYFNRFMCFNTPSSKKFDIWFEGPIEELDRGQAVATTIRSWSLTPQWPCRECHWVGALLKWPIELEVGLNPLPSAPSRPQIPGQWIAPPHTQTTLSMLQAAWQGTSRPQSKHFQNMKQEYSHC